MKLINNKGEVKDFSDSRAAKILGSKFYTGWKVYEEPKPPKEKKSDKKTDNK